MYTPLASYFYAGFSRSLLFDLEDGGDMFHRNGLHGVISHEIEFFITTAVRTSHPILKFVNKI
jgi:hypothetical protein